MPFLAIFIASWVAFLLFADRSRWRELLPACFLAMVLSLASDIVVTHYVLWAYNDPTALLLAPDDYVHLFDDFGIYPVVTYLFLQYYPDTKTHLHKFTYFLGWTTFAISLEHFHHWMGWMEHLNGWTHWHSYAADWLLLYLLVFFHHVYNRDLVPIPIATLTDENVSDNQVPAYIEFVRSIGLELEFISESEEQEVYLLEMKPGGILPLHHHSGRELVVVLRGEVELTVNNEIRRAPQGTFIAIEEHQLHCGRNLSDGSSLLLCAYLPAGLRQSLQTKTYEQLTTASSPLHL